MNAPYTLYPWPHPVAPAASNASGRNPYLYRENPPLTPRFYHSPPHGFIIHPPTPHPTPGRFSENGKFARK